MKDKYQYVLDSSVWVEIDRGNEQITKRVRPLLNKNRICMVDLIIAELLRGVRREIELEGLALRLSAFEVISADWLSVGKLGYDVARAGFNPPLADLYIAQSCIKSKKTLITQDRHFEEIKKVRNFALEVW